MKLLILCLAAVSSANMLMPPAPLKCSPSSNKINHGCLRGQYCDDNRCSTSPYISEKSSGPFDVRIRPRQAPVTADGTCGAQNGGAICGNWPRGNCCSENGWCGNSAAHCGIGCQSGSCVYSPTVTIDGSCGAKNGGTVCGNWPQGNCCSDHGYCGKTVAHCGTGCQSGDCLSLEPVPTAPVTKDGSCGSENKDTICGNWPDGNCCSPYGFCGRTSGHCGAGCQSGDCLTKEVTAPGPSLAPAHATPGVFNVVGQAGVPAMHAALMPNGRVVFLDKVENYTQVMLPNGHYAYSSEYDPVANTYVGLSYSTNAFCSGGAFLRDGRVVSLGGNGPLEDVDPTVKDGFDGIRYLGRAADGSQNGQNWQEPGNKLASARWYASVQTMSDGTLFCASGSLNGLDAVITANNNPTYEILDAQGVSSGKNIPMDILQKNQPYYMYPFIHLLNDGSLFVFTAKSSQRFNVQTNSIVTAYPDLPGDYRTYPNSGGSVMLPLSRANNWAADILICGGGAFQDIVSPTDPSCGRLAPLSAAPAWEMDAMPEGRGMVEGVLLPDSTVLWLNGGSRGAQGFGLMQDPTQEALLYTPSQPLGRRWATLARSTVPRLYHSVALLLLDGRVLVAGSNPVEMPVLGADALTPFATEFRVETYTPPYLQGANAARRPTGIVLSTTRVAAGGTFKVEFVAPEGAKGVEVVMYHGGFVTHSVHMNQRMVVLDVAGFVAAKNQQKVVMGMPPSGNVVPPGPYVVYVLVDGVPGVGQFVSVG